MLIGHLTDLHILEEGQKLGNLIDTNALAVRAVECVNALSPKPAFVVVTGDITHHGRLEQMTVARRILDALTVPYFILPGAHDEPITFRSVFGDLPYFSHQQDSRYLIDEFPVRIVAIDTTTGKGSPPRFTGEQAEWLRDVLSNSNSRPTLLAMHHPPFQCRIPVSVYTNDPTVSWAAELTAIVSGLDVIKLVLCGHVHRSIQTVWAGSLLSVGPSTCVQAEPRFQEMSTAEKGQRAPLLLEPPSSLLHWWDGSRFATYTLFSESFPKV